MKQEFLMLAHVYKPAKHLVAGWYLSEKLDGKRAFWDGGISRGFPAEKIPWANTVKDKKLTTATGLWTRYGKVIYAPDFWLNSLPKIPLDGELWGGRGNFQFITAATARHIPIEAEWERLSYMVFDSPLNFQDRTVKVRDYEYEIKNAMEWIADHVSLGVTYAKDTWNFELIQSFLEGRVTGPYAYLLGQQRIPYQHEEAIEFINSELDKLFAVGAEGLMLRKPESFWTPQRSKFLLKVKPWKIGVGTVIGYRHAEPGKIEGMMGSLILDFDGKRLKISGFTDAERNYGFDYTQAWENPGTEATGDWDHTQFPKGMEVKFKYRELSDDGIPKDARYLRCT